MTNPKKLNSPDELLQAFPDWRTYDAEELVSQYSPSLAPGCDLEERARLVASREAIFRSGYRVIADIVYGDSDRQRIDLILPGGITQPPLHIFVHGGYWRRGDRMGHGRCAQTFVEAGFAAAIIDFDLCPSVTISDQVSQVRNAIAFLWRNSKEWGYRQESFDICGHSTGAHLTAMALTTDWPAAFGNVPADVIRSATLVSGLFDMEPIRAIPQGQDVGLDDDQRVRELSPVLRTPFSELNLLVAAGERESREFQRQSALLAQAWRDKTLSCQFSLTPDRDHIDIMDDLQSGQLGIQALNNARKDRQYKGSPDDTLLSFAPLPYTSGKIQ